MIRRWRNLRPPRGQYWNAWGQANQGQAWPSFTRQAGPSPRYGARLLPSRRRWNDPPWFPPTSVPPPQWLRQAGALRTPARLCPSRRRWNDPGWGQSNQGTAHQQWLRQAGPSPRYGARLNRSQGRRFDLPYPPSVAVPPPVIPPTGGGKSMLSRYMRWADL